MSAEEPEFLIFPITEKNGFEINSVAAYKQLMYQMGNVAVELAEEYPNDIILVTWTVE